MNTDGHGCSAGERRWRNGRGKNEPTLAAPEFENVPVKKVCEGFAVFGAEGKRLVSNLDGSVRDVVVVREFVCGADAENVDERREQYPNNPGRDATLGLGGLGLGLWLIRGVLRHALRIADSQFGGEGFCGGAV